MIRYRSYRLFDFARPDIPKCIPFEDPVWTLDLKDVFKQDLPVIDQDHLLHLSIYFHTDTAECLVLSFDSVGFIVFVLAGGIMRTVTLTLFSLAIRLFQVRL